MKKHGSVNILLIELLIVILFFMLCVSTIVEVFGQARLKSAFARDGSEALILVENLEERMAVSGDPEAELAGSGFTEEGEGWILRKKNYTLAAVPTEEKTEAGVIRIVTFTAEQWNGTRLFELPAVKYIPGEVGP